MYNNLTLAQEFATNQKEYLSLVKSLQFVDSFSRNGRSFVRNLISGEWSEIK